MTTEMTEEQLAAMRRAVSSLFFVLYGTKPRITHKRVRPWKTGKPRMHSIGLTAPATSERAAIDGGANGDTRGDCYTHLIELLRERMVEIHPEEDDWIEGQGDDE